MEAERAGQDGHDMHGRKAGMPMYPFQNKAKNAMRVSEWKSKLRYESNPRIDSSRAHGGLRVLFGIRL